MIGSNLANLSITINSNVSQVQAQLTTLQNTLQTISRTSGTVIPNMGNSLQQLGQANSLSQMLIVNFTGVNNAGLAVNNVLRLWGGSVRDLFNSMGFFGDNIKSTFRDIKTALIDTMGYLRLFGRNMTFIDPFTGMRQSANIFTSTILSMALKVTQAFNRMRGVHSVPGFFTPHLMGIYTIRDAWSALIPVFKSVWTAGSSLIGGLMKPGFTTAIAGATVLTGALGVLSSKIVEVGMEYNSMVEQMRTGYEVMLTGGSKAAEELMKRMESFANVTPFTLPQVGKGAEMLLSYGVGQGAKNQVEQITGAIQMIGDVSRGVPEKMNDIAYAYGQIYAMGRLQGQELRQLINAGFNPLLEISKKTGKSMGVLKKDMEDGKIGINQITQAFIDATSKGGRFYGMMEKQSQTAKGMTSTISDKSSMLAGMFTESLFEGSKPILEDIITLLDMFLERADIISGYVKEYIVPALEEAVKQMLQLVGFTGDGEEGFDNITESVKLWIQSIAGGIKAMMFVVNVVALFVAIFVAGVASIGMAFVALWAIIKVIVQVIADIIMNLCLGISAGFEWATRKVAVWIRENISIPFAKAWNDIADAIGATDWKMEVEAVPAGWGDKNDSWDELKRWNNDPNNSYLKIGEDFVNQMNPLIKASELSSKVAGGAWENLTGDTSGVDKLFDNLDKKKKAKKPYEKADPKSLLGAVESSGDKVKKTKDLFKAAADDAKKLADAIWDLTNKFVNMGNVFDKMSYEKFSPYKLITRMQRFFDEMKNWTKNLTELSSKGVPETMINQLREMGIQGYGLTKALSMASPEQRSQIVSQYSQSRQMGWDVATAKIKQDEKVKNLQIIVTGNSVVSPELVDKLTNEIVRKIRLQGL